MTRFSAIVEYSGDGFSGMQKQVKDITIQQCLEEALSKLFNEEIVINFAGRTDAGVHATGQVIDFASSTYRDCDQILRGTNYFLGERLIRLTKVTEVPLDFNSRFDAKMRHYVYKIINRKADLTIHKKTHCLVRKPIDLNLLQQASDRFIGLNDFSYFRNSNCDKNPIRTLSNIRIEYFYQSFGLEIHIFFSAKSFLYNMIRKIVGTIIRTSLNEFTIDQIDYLLGKSNQNILQKEDVGNSIFHTNISGIDFDKEKNISLSYVKNNNDNIQCKKEILDIKIPSFSANGLYFYKVDY